MIWTKYFNNTRSMTISKYRKQMNTTSLRESKRNAIWRNTKIITDVCEYFNAFEYDNTKCR